MKKGRAFLTAYAGSIGIIGIALILSLSNGVNQYVSDIERESLSNFPIALEQNTYDFSKLLSSVNQEKVECNGVLCSRDDITGQLSLFTDKVIQKNDLRSFKNFINHHDEIKNLAAEIDYGYALDLQIYSTNHSHYTRIHPNSFNVLGNMDITANESFSTSDSNVAPVFQELFDNGNILNDQYEILSGRFPQEYNELVLVVGQDGFVLDFVLYALDIKDRKELGNILDGIEDVMGQIESTNYSYDDIIGLSYKLILNTDYYVYENGIYKDYSNDFDYMKNIINQGLDMKIVGILRVLNEDIASSFIGYHSTLTEYVINQVSKTDLYKKQVENPDINVLTGERFDGVIHTYESNCKLLGIADLQNPSTIHIYPKDFDSKERILSFIDQYNRDQREKGENAKVVHYTDLIKTVIGGVTSVVHVVSFVLIGFVAISLFVSSIMIAIITYISVLERTKEVGVLRAIGASKKDVSRVFKAETMIAGLIAGVLGIGIALCLCIPINIIVFKLVKVEGIASMPIGGAIILILLSIFLNVIAGSIPSKMASCKDPVDALRNE